MSERSEKSKGENIFITGVIKSYKQEEGPVCREIKISQRHPISLGVKARALMMTYKALNIIAYSFSL